MLKSEHRRIVDELWERLSDQERAFLVGYVNGRAQSLTGGAAPAANAPTLHIYFATETGNAKSIAAQLEKQAKARGYKTKNQPLAKIKPADLATIQDPVVFITSTQGEGDPPDMARKFFTTLMESIHLKLPDLRYAVLGLGDKSYKHFCRSGEFLNSSFAVAGAQAFHAKAMLDVDYAQHVPAWINGVLESLGKISPVEDAPSGSSRAAASVAHTSTRGFTRLEPLRGTIKDVVNLNDRGSRKETYHIELAFEEHLPYAPGDAAGILMPHDADGTVPAPRLYSIASSPLANPQELHLTVAHSTYAQPDGTLGYGLCSHFLSQKKPGDTLEFYIQRNQRFRLPEDDAADIIMIGPGTGVAPFRAFVQERSERGASGRNWLFFGEQHAHCDFLYQAEWQDYLNNGALARLDVAFSRDQKQKIYVQDRLREQAVEMYRWIESGAHIYVCGSKSPMSEDVDAALADIIATQGSVSLEAAHERLEQMALDDLYLKDVY